MDEKIAIGISIFTILGSGVVVAIINWVQIEYSKNKDRKINFLDRQLKDLYGPLFYFVSQSEKLFELYNKIHQAYKEEYVNIRYSLDDNTQKNIHNEADITLEIGNKYINEVQKNNIEIKKILDKCYSLIDSNDIEVFSLFYEHYNRLNTEVEDSGKLKMPYRIHKYMGDISFLRPEFIKKVKEQFLMKKEELKQYVK